MTSKSVVSDVEDSENIEMLLTEEDTFTTTCK